MCDFVSWIEYDDQILFLTDAELNTKRGRELRKYLGNQYYEDIKGHGAIRFYYEIGDKGHNKECTDLSDPNIFPSVITEAIKKGKFSKISLPKNPMQLIRDFALAEYEKVIGSALAEYEKVEGSAFWKIVRIKKNRVKNWE